MKSPSGVGLSIREHFLDDHRRLERIFEGLLDAFECGSREELSELWTRFESSLERHMVAEEKWMLPAFARENHDEAERIKAEHADIRRRLTEIGVGVDLHIIRLPVAKAFVDSLRAHAARENELLYKWIDDVMSVEERRSILRELGRTVRKRVA